MVDSGRVDYVDPLYWSYPTLNGLPGLLDWSAGTGPEAATGLAKTTIRCGWGGMITVPEEFLQQATQQHTQHRMMEPTIPMKINIGT